MPKMLTPISLKIKIEKITRISPETADVNNSCPLESFFGSPEEVII